MSALTHKVAKGDTLEGIAKRYGQRDWRAIWNALPNKGIVSKRRKPESIQPGDLLVIPPNEKEIREKAAKLAALQTSRDANQRLSTTLQAEIARCAKGFNVLSDLIPATVRHTQQVIAELEADLASMKNWESGVDTAKALVDLAGPVKKLGEAGLKAATGGAKELARFVEEGRKLADDVKRDSDMDKAIGAAADALKDDENPAVAALGILADSYQKMTSPSFWANAIVQMKQGKSWSEAMTREVGADVRERIKMVETSHDKQIHQLHEAHRRIKTQMETRRRLWKECEQRLKVIDAQIKASA